jgi:hypothetical protein
LNQAQENSLPADWNKPYKNLLFFLTGLLQLQEEENNLANWTFSPVRDSIFPADLPICVQEICVCRLATNVLKNTLPADLTPLHEKKCTACQLDFFAPQSNEFTRVPPELIQHFRL